MLRHLFQTLLVPLVILKIALSSAEPFTIALCTEGGVKCDPSCRRLGSCINIEGQYQWEEALSCGNKYCNINTLSCTSELENCVPNADKIGCGTKGIFPDPYDCKSRYECSDNLTATKIIDYCTNVHGYDACTYQCDVTLPNNRCPDVGALCQNPTQIGVVDGNKRMFYQCVSDLDGVLYPVLHICPDGFFDEGQRQCVPSSESGC